MTLKKIFSVLLALTMLFVCACDKDKNEDVPERNYNSEFVLPGIKMDIPEDYLLDNEDTEHPFYYKRVEEEDALYTITLTSETTESTFDSYCYFAKDKLKQLDGFTLFSEENATISNLPARISEFQYQVEYNTGTETFYCAHAILVSSKAVYVISCIAGRLTYENERDTFMHCINSIQIH